MPTRVVRDGILTSERVNLLTTDAMLRGNNARLGVVEGQG